MPSQNHVHKYKKNKLGKDYVVYECVLPDCTHYLPESRVVGKKCVCWVCGKVTTVHRDSNGILVKPHCKTCTKTVNNGRKKSKKEEKDTMEMFDLPPLNIPNILP